MAVTLSRYLRLRIDSNLTANSKYNLDRLDTLGSTFIVDTLSNLNIRSESDVTIEPNSADLGGTGTGGDVTIGTSNHTIDSFRIYASDVTFSSNPGLLDQGTSGTKYLRLKYNSTLSGSVDTTADRTLSLDLEGADRSMILGGDLNLGSTFTTATGALSLTMPVAGLSWTLPANSTGYLQNNGSGTLSWVSVSGTGNVLGENYTWSSGDGTTKVITHTLASTNVEVQLYDNTDGSSLMVDSINIDSTSQITLTSSEAPASSWNVVLQAKA